MTRMSGSVRGPCNCAWAYSIFDARSFSRQVPFRATGDECLVLQQALNLASQIRLLGAEPLRPRPFRCHGLMAEWVAEHMVHLDDHFKKPIVG